MEAKEIIIEKFYDEHRKPSVIAKELGVNPSYVTKVIQKDDRYILEKEYRAKISKENRVKFNIDLIKKYKVKLIKKFNMKI